MKFLKKVLTMQTYYVYAENVFKCCVLRLITTNHGGKNNAEDQELVNHLLLSLRRVMLCGNLFFLKTQNLNKISRVLM